MSYATCCDPNMSLKSNACELFCGYAKKNLAILIVLLSQEIQPLLLSLLSLKEAARTSIVVLDLDQALDRLSQSISALMTRRV
jgi:hypothetical protein